MVASHMALQLGLHFVLRHLEVTNKESRGFARFGCPIVGRAVSFNYEDHRAVYAPVVFEAMQLYNICRVCRIELDPLCNDKTVCRTDLNDQA